MAEFTTLDGFEIAGLRAEVTQLRADLSECLAELAAYRKVSKWSSAQVRHFAACERCVPICGHEEYYCSAYPREG